MIGAVLGAVAVNYGRSVLTNYFPEAWPFILGELFVVVTLFPDGLVGIIRKLFARKEDAGVPGPTEASPTAPQAGGSVT